MTRRTRIRTALLVRSIAAVVFLAADGRASDFYACDCTTAGHDGACTGQGSDSTGDGSLGNPYQTLLKLHDSKYASSGCGDTFNICYGSATALTTNLEWGDVSSCSQGQNRWVQAYTASGSKATALPLVYATTRDQLGFTVDAPGSNTANPTRMDNAVGFRYLELRCDNGAPYALCDSDLPGGFSGLHGVAVWLFDHSTNVKFDHMTVDGWGMGIRFDGSSCVAGSPSGCATAGIHSSAQVTNSYFHDIAFHGMQGLPGSGTVVSDSFFDWIGCRKQTTGSCTFEHTIYFNTTSDVQNMQFIRNLVTHPSMSTGSSPAACDSTVIKFFNGIGTTFANNMIVVDESQGPSNPDCSVIAMTTQSWPYPNSGCTNCVLSNNQIVGGNLPIVIAGWVGGGTVENNVVIEPHPAGGNKQNGCQWLDIQDDNSSLGAKMGMNGTGPTIRYNSAYIEDEQNPCRGLEDDLAGNAEPGHISLYGNACWYNGMDTNARCFDVAASQLVHYDRFDYNVAYAPTIWSGSQTLAQWQTNTVGVGGHPDLNRTGKILHVPGVVSSSNLHLAAGAYAIGQGDPAHYPATDHDGNFRSSPPDAGAYQFGATGGGIARPYFGLPGKPVLGP